MADLTRERRAEQETPAGVLAFWKRSLAFYDGDPPGPDEERGFIMSREHLVTLLSMAERAVSWTLIDYDDPSTLPSDDDWRLLRYDDGRSGGSGVIRGRWDPDGPRWFDDETDGTNSQLEWPPGFITHWAPWPEFPEAEAIAKGTR